VKHIACWALALTLVAGATGAQAQQKPDFSGTWAINQVKSNFGAVPAPSTLTRKIVHVEPSLAIDEAQETPIGMQHTSRKYVADGTESTFEASGATVRTSAKWDGDAIVVVSTVDIAKMVYNDRMMLSADGKTLTSVLKIQSPQGAVDITVVFDKQ
jgi:hypothetical protein